MTDTWYTNKKKQYILYPESLSQSTRKELDYNLINTYFSCICADLQEIYGDRFCNMKVKCEIMLQDIGFEILRNNMAIAVFANIKEDNNKTNYEIENELNNKILPVILRRYPMLQLRKMRA